MMRLAALVLALASPALAQPTTRPAFLAPDADARAHALLAQMTLAEKLGQLTQFSGNDTSGPSGARVDAAELMRQGGVGSMLNVIGAAEVNKLQREAVERSRLRVPVLFALDVIHGYRTVYPVPLAVACAWDPALAERLARMAAIEASADGLRWTFAPMVDVARDARWGRVVEGAGEDPHLGALMAAAQVRGYQLGGDLADPTALLACAKHFAAYGAAIGGRDYDGVDVSAAALRDVYLPPFRAASDAGVGSFMSAFNSLNGVPASADRALLTGTLRDEWGFGGLLVSDWSSVNELVAHGAALDGADAARQGVLAGVDMDMASNLYATELPKLVDAGTVPMARVDEAVLRVLRAKVALGLFERPYADETLAARVTLTPEHRALAREAAERSFVLLKNDAAVLPIAAGRTVALIGELADNRLDMLGPWSAQGRPEDVVTLRAALAERLGDKLIWAEGVRPDGDSDAGFADALAAARRADVVVLALGERRGQSGEASSRATLDLPGKQRALLEQVVALGKPTALVLFNGRPLALPWEAERVPALLEAWFPGVEAGPALARTLLGDVAPSGRLAASFPRSIGQVPIFYARGTTGRPGDRSTGDAWITGYRDEKNTPLFAFGHGLTYTTFEYGPTTADGGKVRATVKNTGERAGVETAQCYVRRRGGGRAWPRRELVAFERVELQPGEARAVTFDVDAARLGGEGVELTFLVAPHAETTEPGR